MSSETPSANPHAKRRRWYQFSLRTLIIFMVLVSIVFGAFAVRLQRARWQAEAVATIRRSGGSVQYDYQYYCGEEQPIATLIVDSEAKSSVPQWMLDSLGEDFFHEVTSVDLIVQRDAHGRELPPSTLLAALNRFGKLQDLAIEIRNESRSFYLRDLDELQHLQTVFIYGNGAKMSKEDFRALSSLPKLEQLTVCQAEIHDDDLAALVTCQSLWSIDLGFTNVTDRGLSHLSSLKNLKYVELNKTNVTDEGIKQLMDLPNLRRLKLADTSVTGRGLMGFASLEYVDLWASDATDEGLVAIATCPALSEVRITGTHVTVSGIERFRDLRPDVRVDGL